MKKYVFVLGPLMCENCSFKARTTDAQRENSLYCTAENSLPLPNFLSTAKAYFVCHIDPIFQISFIYAFTGCSVVSGLKHQCSGC